MMLPVLYLPDPSSGFCKPLGKVHWSAHFGIGFEKYSPISVINQLTCADQASPLLKLVCVLDCEESFQFGEHFQEFPLT